MNVSLYLEEALDKRFGSIIKLAKATGGKRTLQVCRKSDVCIFLKINQRVRLVCTDFDSSVWLFLSHTPKNAISNLRF